MPGSVTLRDIATLAGVSVATMSHALNGTGRLAPETRRRLEALLAQHTYIPSPGVAALAQRRRQSGSGLLQVAVIGGEVWDFTTGPIQDFARRAGYLLLAMNGLSPAAVEQRCLDQGIVGVFVMPVPGPATALDFPWSRLPVVAVFPVTFHLPWHQVDIAPFAELRIAVRKLLERGYQRIGVCLHRHDQRVFHDEERMGAWLYSREVDGEVLVPPCTCAHVDLDGLLAWVREQRPDVVLAYGGWHARFLRMHCPGLPLAALTIHGELPEQRNIAGIVHDAQEVCDVALGLLGRSLRLGERGIPERPQRLVVQGRWRDGDSLG